MENEPGIVGVPFYCGNNAFLAWTAPEQVGGERYYRELFPETYHVWLQMGRKIPRWSHDPGWFLEDGHRDIVRIRAIVQARLLMTYGHLLECFFLHFFANVQAPSIPEGWLSVASTKALRNLAGLLTVRPWDWSQTTLALHNPDCFLRWLFGYPHAAGEPSLDESKEVAAIISLISTLAGDLRDESLIADYNAMKHGSRTINEPFEVRRAKWAEGDADPRKVTPPCSPQSTEILYCKGIGLGQLATTYRLREWNPKTVRRRASLVSDLMFNLVAARGHHRVTGRFVFAERKHQWEDEEKDMRCWEVRPDVLADPQIDVATLAARASAEFCASLTNRRVCVQHLGDVGAESA